MKATWTPTEFVAYVGDHRILVWVNQQGWCWRLYRGHRTVDSERGRYLTSGDAKDAALAAAVRHGVHR